MWTTQGGTPAPWPEEALNVSYMWSEQLLRGFYEHYPWDKEPDPTCSPPWRPICQDNIEQAAEWGMISEGWHMLNGWSWLTLARDRDSPDCRLDQTHPGGESGSVNILFGDFHVGGRECEVTEMRKVRSAPYGPDPQ